jgi:enoyl-CoA hydratase/carnithine racemase
VSSEFVLACDMRFASCENTQLGQPEVGVGLHPGGGGTERLPHLVGRGRALEIVLGANDFDGDTAERYGYVNRALPDAELDGFVDALARGIASFDRRAIAAAKNLINHGSLPSTDRLLAAITSFETALTWPEAQQRIPECVATRTPTRQQFRKGMACRPQYASRKSLGPKLQVVFEAQGAFMRNRRINVQPRLNQCLPAHQ